MGAVHVELSCYRQKAALQALAKEIIIHIKENYEWLRLGDEIFIAGGSAILNDVESIRVTDHDFDYEISSFKTSNVEISLDIFELWERPVRRLADMEPPTDGQMDEASHPDAPSEELNTAVGMMDLPHRSLVDAWDNLLFEDHLKFKMLRYIIRRVKLSEKQFAAKAVSNWSRMILIYGPPGTGKTTLCQGLAQKLSIRLSSSFPFARLIQIDAQSIFSRWFSESGKMVTKLFSALDELMHGAEECLFCVLIDEVESIAGTRQYGAGANEPKDALRAVNSLLIALDRFRQRRNGIIFCTSNLVEAIDPAFLDRVSRKQFIPNPCAAARYDILRCRYLELARCGIITPSISLSSSINIRTTSSPSSSSATTSERDSRSHSGAPVSSITTVSDAVDTLSIDLPPCKQLPLLPYSRSNSLAQSLWSEALGSEDFSGRTLRDLPEDTLGLYAVSDPCPLEEAIRALGRGVKEHRGFLERGASHASRL